MVDKITKLLNRISQKDREKLLQTIEKLLNDQTESRKKKIQGTDLYKTRSGRFRIIFHVENNELIIDSIKLRNESTYKNL